MIVRLLDVDLVDIPARVIAERKSVLTTGPITEIEFELELEPPQKPVAGSSLSAEIRMGGGDLIRKGDWLTTRSYPVSQSLLTGESPIAMTVEQLT